MEELEKLRIVLVEPTHPGNIGAVARSMKTMGLGGLVLVNPHKFPHQEATRRAAGAADVLQNAKVVDSVRSSIADCTLVFGTSVRDREVSLPTLDPRQAAAKMLQHIGVKNQQSAVNPRTTESQQGAILFGRESRGLTNDELALCNWQIRIGANPQYSSLNLASAVQIISYELRMTASQQRANSPPTEVNSGGTATNPLSPQQRREQSANLTQREGHFAHLLETLEQLEFIKSRPPTLLMRKLTRLYNKAELSVEEIQILRGILTAIQTQLRRSNKQ
ncbi:MAG: RNA methyltransferase [Gammaproteobacteria bacterium]|nr:RNA methyltransferase [Gammaproteobacteria bacterium]